VESYRTEEEQLEALKRWWAENGRGLLLAVGLALAASLGWQAWQGRQQQQAEGAAQLYQQMLMGMDPAQQSAGGEQLRSLALQLKEDYSGQAYAQFAALHLARLAVEEGELATAAEELRWVLERAPAGSELAAVARLRLARVQAAQGQTDSALATLSAREAAGFAGAYAAARGDILLAAGREQEAREAYLAAGMGSVGPAGADPGRLLAQKLEYLEARAGAAGSDGAVQNP
jgi:predicted negative regulator of RcsB-dependent stress response